MRGLYVVSVLDGAGKTTLCAGLGAYFVAKGLSIGYLSVSDAPSATDAPPAGDASFLEELLHSPESFNALSLLLSDQAGAPDRARSIQEALARAAAGNALVLIESRGGLPSVALLDELEAQALLVVRYAPRLSSNALLEAVVSFGERLVGVVLNAVPEQALRGIAKSLVQSLEAKGVTMLGVIPWDRMLMAPSIGDLARWLEGEILNASEKSEDLVENLLAGSRSADPADPYFARKSELGMICRGDLVDVQLTALEADIKCIVLTGGGEPHFSVRYRAEDLEIPLLRVKTDTVGAIEKLDEGLAGSRFRHRAKLHRVQQLLAEHVKLDVVEEALGLVSSV